MYYGDSYYYLQDSQTLRPDSLHPAIYAFLLWSLHTTGSLLSVSVLQHVLGLLAGLFVYVLCIRQGVRPWLAAIAAAPVLLDMYEVVVEQMVLSDCLAVFLLALSLLLASGRGRSTAALAGLSFALAALTRTVLLAGLPALLVVAWRARSTGQRPLRIGALLLCLALPLVGYASWMHAVTGQYGFESASGLLYYGRVADLADCGTLHLTKEEGPLCDPVSKASRRGPGFYMWSSQSPLREHFRAATGEPWVFPSAVTVGFAERVILAQPGDYLASVASQFFNYLSPFRRTYDKGDPPRIYMFPTSSRPNKNAVPATVGFPVSGGKFELARAPLTLVRPVAKLLRRVEAFLYTSGPLLAAAVLVALFGYLVGLRRDKDLRVIGARAIGLALGGVTLLLGTAAVGMFDWRLLLPVLVLIPPGGSMGAEVVLRWLRARPARRFEAREPKSRRGAFGRNRGPAIRFSPLSRQGA